MVVLMKLTYQNYIKIKSKIKQSLPYLLIVMGISHIFYFCAKAINTLAKYISKKINGKVPQEIIKYPQPKKEEDIIGI